MIEPDHLDEFEVREWFSRDPLRCVEDKAAKSILRKQDFGWRPWVSREAASRRAGTMEVTPCRWDEGYWESLSGYLKELVDSAELASRIADFLVGFLLVVENETPGRNHRESGIVLTREKPLKPTSVAEQDQRLHRLRRIVGAPATSRPQRRESLKVILSKEIVDNLVKDGLSRKLVCEERLPLVWAAIDINMDPASILRMERRSRQKARRLKRR